MPSTSIPEKTQLYRYLNSSILAFALCTFVSGCASDTVNSAASVDQINKSNTASSSPIDARSTTSVTQIASSDTGFTAQQISRDVDTVQLTVEQLKTYADRCVPGKSTYRDDIDCSELSLRLKKVFRSDDKINEALFTLDRLGRSVSNSSVSNELDRNYGDLSHSAQAVAGGLQDPSPVEPPEDAISDDLEKFLNQNGLGINAGIIVNSGG